MKTFRLPSCTQCRSRKIKCDTKRPKCANCARHDIPCDYIDPSTNQSFTGLYIQQLEEEQEALETQRCLQNANDGVPPSYTNNPQDSTKNEPKKVIQPQDIKTGGISFLKVLFADPEWRQRNNDLLQKFAEKPQTFEPNIRPATLPDRQVAWFLFEKYFNGTHVQNPFMLRKDVEMMFNRVYSHVGVHLQNSGHDYFTIYMIIAIASVTLFREGTHSGHPVSYYLSALGYFDVDFLGHNLRGIQDLLLIARFGIYHHIGTSIWDIAQICMRMCIEQGLHRQVTSPIEAICEQVQRRVFWHCYAIDRYSSTTLGRPFAIDDSDIEVPFPIRVGDDKLITWTGSLDNYACGDEVDDEMSIFLFYVRSRQITSRMHGFFDGIGKSSDDIGISPIAISGRIHVEVAKLLAELKQWRNTAPTFSIATCLYHHSEWHDFMFERYRLSLLRAAIEAVPKKEGVPPRELIDMIAESSIELILLYAGLYERGIITYTRSYFQMLFTSGLSLMYSIATLDHLKDFGIQDRATEALKTCEDLLKAFSVQMKDSVYYTAIFEALHRETIRRSALFYQQFLTTTAPTRRGSPTGGHIINAQYPANGPDLEPLMQQWNQRQTDELLAPLPQHQSSGVYGYGSVLEDSISGNAFSNVDWLGNLEARMPAVYGQPTWDGFNEGWTSVELGVQEYAYGDPSTDLHIWNELQSGILNTQ